MDATISGWQCGGRGGSVTRVPGSRGAHCGGEREPPAALRPASRSTRNPCSRKPYREATVAPTQGGHVV